MHRYLTNIWSFVRPLIPKSIPLGSNLQAFPYFFLSVKISIRKNFSFPFTIFLLFSSHPFRVVSYFSGPEQISDLQIFQVFILSVLNLVPLLFPEIFLWPDPKSSFKIFGFEKFFSNCQRLCSFWMRFEGFRASDKISVQQLVTFHCVSRLIPALEINRLWKEFLFSFWKAVPNFILPIWGRHFFKRNSCFKRTLVSIPFRNRPQIKLMFLCSNQFPFGNFPLIGKLKLGFLWVRSRSAVLVTSLLCLHYSTLFVFVKRFGENFLPFLQLFFGNIFCAFKTRWNGLFVA